MNRILIVDDEQKIRDVYRGLLKDEGYHVLEASNAKEAIDILLVDRVDMVLLDLNMPGIDGREMMDIVNVYDLQFKVMVASVYPLGKQKEAVPNADGYYDKSQGTATLLSNIKNVIQSPIRKKNINRM